MKAMKMKSWRNMTAVANEGNGSSEKYGVAGNQLAEWRKAKAAGERKWRNISESEKENISK
jgi:hypothetical protein